LLFGLDEFVDLAPFGEQFAVARFAGFVDRHAGGSANRRVKQPQLAVFYIHVRAAELPMAGAKRLGFGARQLQARHQTITELIIMASAAVHNLLGSRLLFLGHNHLLYGRVARKCKLCHATSMDLLLHTENFRLVPFRGRRLKKQILRRLTAVERDAKGLKDPNISVLIRTRNDRKYIEQLFNDIEAQLFDGKVEVIVVDTESTDGTVEFARAKGAKIITITQQEFTYPKALNLGFKAAKYPYVAVLVGHSNLVHRLLFQAVTVHAQDEKFGGMGSLPFPNWNASWSDRIGAALWPEPVWSKNRLLKKSRGGMLSANCSVVSRKAWQALGGYDERYAGGGEDTALGRSMMQAGYKVYMDPAGTVYHSHGLSFLNSLKQMLHWSQVAGTRPQVFDAQKIHARRPDLR